ncbi:MAG: acyl carrier protein [Ginsengibacter sp.]
MEEKLRNIIGNVFEIDPDQVNEVTSQDTLANWDSIHHLNLIVSLEESYNVNFTDEETVQLTNYKVIKSILQEKGAFLT